MEFKVHQILNSTQTKIKVIASTNPGTVTDFDGNVYQTVLIGQQLWMDENLKVTHYSNGDAIPNVTDNSQWAQLTSGAYSWYDNDIAWSDAYGALYNWFTVVDNRNLCPAGWHIPSDAEWTILTDYLGGLNIAGGKMKSTRSEPEVHPRWNSPNFGATNESGFTALPGGYRDHSSGTFSNIGRSGYFWSSCSDEVNPNMAWFRSMNTNIRSVTRDTATKRYGRSVRCLRD